MWLVFYSLYLFVFFFFNVQCKTSNSWSMRERKHVGFNWGVCLFLVVGGVFSLEIWGNDGKCIVFLILFGPLLWIWGFIWWCLTLWWEIFSLKSHILRVGVSGKWIKRKRIFELLKESEVNLLQKRGSFSSIFFWLLLPCGGYFFIVSFYG